jgi:cytochrome c
LRWRTAASARALMGWTVAAGLLVTGCSTLPLGRPAVAQAGEPEFGRRALADYGCISCHVIPGIDSAGSASYVAAPLTRWAQRTYIAGALVNDQENLVRWIMDPQSIEPDTAMPDLDVTQEDAVNMAAYLLSLD